MIDKLAICNSYVFKELFGQAQCHVKDAVV